MIYALMTYALMACALMSSADEELRFRFQPGDKYFLVSVTKQRMARIVHGNEQTTEQTVWLGCDLDVEEVEESGCAWAKYTYRQAVMKIKGLGVDTTYDSEANQPQVPFEALPLALELGESFYMKITPQGHIDKINGLQAIVVSAKGKLPNVKGREQLVGAVENLFAESAIRRVLESQLAVFPDPNTEHKSTGAQEHTSAAVMAGALTPCSWSRTEQINEENAGVPVVVEQTWRLRETSGTVAVIDVNLVIRPTAEKEETTIGGAKARREVRGHGTGRVEIEKVTGRIIANTLTKDLVEEVEVFAQGPMLRPPAPPEPVRTHIVTTFQMIDRENLSDANQTTPPSPAKPEANQPAS